MFLGQFTHSVDAKGRLTIPVRFRSALASGAFVTQGFDKNLIVYTTASFERLAARATSLTTTDPDARAVRRSPPVRGSPWARRRSPPPLDVTPRFFTSRSFPHCNRVREADISMGLSVPGATPPACCADRSRTASCWGSTAILRRWRWGGGRVRRAPGG